MSTENPTPTPEPLEPGAPTAPEPAEAPTAQFEPTAQFGRTAQTDRLAEPAPAPEPAPHAPATAPGVPGAPVAAPQPEKRTRPRSGPIVWGCLVLVFCAYIAQRVFAPGTVDNAVWITATLFGLGVLLLGVGVAILVRNTRNR